MKSIFKIAAAVWMAGLPLACARPPAAVVPAPPDGGDAQRLVTVLDYVGSDYARAVREGAVVNAAEYDEQLKFVDDMRALTASVLGGRAAPGDPLAVALSRVESEVGSRADPADVARACRAAKEEAVARFGLRTVPTETPSLEAARTLYAQSCAVCHGASGDARTEQAARLDAPSFRDPARRAALSPYRVYNTLTFGVRGTAMASFEALSPAERWALAFYVLRLGHEGEPATGPVSVSLADQAARTDGEVVDALRSAGARDVAGALAWVRTEGAFQEPPAETGLERTRAMLRDALA